MIPQMLGRYLLGTTPWVSPFQRQSPLYHDDDLDVMVIIKMWVPAISESIHMKEMLFLNFAALKYLSSVQTQVFFNAPVSLVGT